MANVFHCCVQKTASQWIRKIFSDPRCVRASGLSPFNFYENINDAEQKSRLAVDFQFDTPFPNNTVVTPLYINYSSFCSIPKSEPYKAFFVVRDPRDLVVSWYFSVRHSHDEVDEIQPHRDRLQDLPIAEGLILSIQQLASAQYFSSILSWVEAPKQDANVKIYKFEDLTAPIHIDTFEDLFSHCGITISKPMLETLLKRYSFRQMAQRHQGVEDASSHYRKGLAGDWINYFDESVEKVFQQTTGDLLERLGYQSSREEALEEQLQRTKAHLELATKDYHVLQDETRLLIEQLQQMMTRIEEANGVIKDKDKFRQIPIDYIYQLENSTCQLSNDISKLSDDLRSTTQEKEHLHDKLRQSRSKVRELRQRLQNMAEEATSSKEFMHTVQSSKFWKLRNRWAEIKGVFVKPK